MKAYGALLAGMAVLFVASSCSKEREAARGAAAATTLELSISSVRKVVETSEDIELSCTLCDSSRKPFPVETSAQGGEVLIPVLVTVEGQTRSSSVPTEFRAPAGTPSFVYAGKCIVAGIPQGGRSEKWPLGPITVKAVYAAPADSPTGPKGDEKAKPVEITSNVLEMVVKADGWRANAYRTYIDVLEKALRDKLGPLAFEFPEVRDLKPASITAKPDGALGIFKLTREYLDIDDKTKTARLKRAEGSLEFAVVDPWAPEPGGKSDLCGLVEDGLVALDFRYKMTTNKWLADKLYSVESQIVKELKGTVAWPAAPAPDAGLAPLPESVKKALPGAGRSGPGGG